MCERCNEQNERVAAQLGMDAATVERVRLALYAAMREEDEAQAEDTEEALTAIMGVPVVPRLLGLEPFILLSMMGRYDVGGEPRYRIRMESAGFDIEDARTVLTEALASLDLHETGGVGPNGELIEWAVGGE